MWSVKTAPNPGSASTRDTCSCDAGPGAGVWLKGCSVVMTVNISLGWTSKHPASVTRPRALSQPHAAHRPCHQNHPGEQRERWKRRQDPGGDDDHDHCERRSPGKQYHDPEGECVTE